MLLLTETILILLFKGGDLGFKEIFSCTGSSASATGLRNCLVFFIVLVYKPESNGVSSRHLLKLSLTHGLSHVGEQRRVGYRLLNLGLDSLYLQRPTVILTDNPLEEGRSLYYFRSQS